MTDGFPNDDIVTVLRTMVQYSNAIAGGVFWRAADEIERLRKENAEWKELVNHPIWAKPPRMTCTKHGIKYLCFDDFMGGVWWCEGCKDE